MSDVQTPMPDQKPTNPLVAFWASLSKNAKIVITVVAVIIFFAIVGSGSSNNNTPTTQPTVTVPSTISVADQWSEWKSSFMPLVNQTETDYTTTQADLSNYDSVAATSDFAQLSQDATDWIGYNNSPNAEVNRLVNAVSVDLQMISSNGVLVLSGDQSASTMADFQKACQDFNNDTTALATAIGNANSSY